MRMVMIDNYDSFTFNLVHLFYEFGIEVLVHRNDEISLREIEALAPHWICISPGPRDPAHAGISKAVARRFGGRVPMLGVCLGMQAINEVFGGRTVKSPIPVHGKQQSVRHEGLGILAGLPSPFGAARYHSLCVDVRSPDIAAIARCDDGVIMAIQHRFLPLAGVQFHPESFLSECGKDLARNFLSFDPEFGQGM